MKRWIPLLLLVAACQLDAPPPTPTTSSDVSAATTCQLPPTTCAVPMPKLVAWNWQYPQPGPNQVFFMFPNWESQGDYVVTLTDYDAGKVVWGAKIKAADVAQARAMLDPEGMYWGPRPPLPPPGPIGGTGAGAWIVNTMRFATNHL